MFLTDNIFFFIFYHDYKKQSKEQVYRCGNMNCVEATHRLKNFPDLHTCMIVFS